MWSRFGYPLSIVDVLSGFRLLLEKFNVCKVTVFTKLLIKLSWTSSISNSEPALWGRH